MEEEIKKVYKEMYTAMVEKNEKKLNELYDDSFILVHMTGIQQTKKEYINSIVNRTLNYFSVIHESISIIIKYDMATLVGKSIVEAAVFGGGKHKWHLCLNMQLINKKDRWFFIKANASIY